MVFHYNYKKNDANFWFTLLNPGSPNTSFKGSLHSTTSTYYVHVRQSNQNKINKMDINNNKMADDFTTNDIIAKMTEDNNNVAQNNSDDSSSDDDDDQYETSYSKFTNNKQRRSVVSSRGSNIRRRGGYGNSSSMSILETLKPPTTVDGGNCAMDDVVSPADDNNNNNNEQCEVEEDVSRESPDDDFGLNMNDFISQEFLGSGGTQTTDIFMNGSDNEEEDDDATHPYNVESDLEKIGPWTGDVESDDDDDVDNGGEGEEEVQYHTSRGRRTKQTKKVIATKSNDEEDGEDRGNNNNSDIEEENVVDDDNSGEAVAFNVELGKEEEDQVESDKVDTLPNDNENHPTTESTTTSTNTTEETPNNNNNDEPSKRDLLSLVDTLFTSANKDTMTVGDINRSVATHYGWAKVDKKRKKLIKTRLTDLMQGTVSVGEGLDDDEEGEGEEAKKKEKKSSNKSKKKRGKKKKFDPSESSDVDEENMEDNLDDEEIVDGDDDDDESYEEERSTKKKKKKKKESTKTIQEGTTTPRSSRRSKSKSGKGKMAKHLRDHHSKARLRQMEEARIREEELGHLADDDDDDELVKKNDKEQDDARPKVSNEDRQRAEEISARFNTNREELVVKRREDRVGLIGRLRTARMEQLEENLTLSALATDVMVKKADANVKVEESVEEGQPKLTFVPKLLEKDDKAAMVDLDSSDEDEEGSDDDDLEIIAPSSKDEDAIISPKISKRKMSVVDLLINSNKTSFIRRDPQKNLMKSKADPRMLMRNALRAQKVAAGNKWLAK